MYILYARKNSGSAAVEALLTLLNLPHQVRQVEKTEHGGAPDWYLKINPRGEVPSLQLPDHGIMTESAAMMIYLADAHPEANLAPAVTSPQRAAYLRWMVYLSANAYASDLRLYYPERYSTDPQHAPSIKARASQHLARDFEIFARQISPAPFLFGKTPSAADLYAAMLFTWSDDMAKLFKDHPQFKMMFESVSNIPAVAEVWARNGMA